MEKIVLKLYNKNMKKIVEGSISVKAVLESEKRQCEVLYVNKKKRNKDFAYIIALAKKRGIPVKLCTPEEIEAITQGKTHGGIALEVLEREFVQLDKKIEGMSCYIDGLEDPYNFGSVCRTLYAAGCTALFLPKRDWSKSESTILKASAGAYEKLDLYFVAEDETFIQYLKKFQIPLYCAYRDQATSIYDIDYPKTCCIAIGGALRGLSRKILDAANQNIVIDYARDFRNALDTPSATAVIAFEIARRRR